MRRYIAFIFLATALLAVGCKKDDPTPPMRDRSYMHVLGAVANDTIDLTFDYYNADDVVIKDFVFARNFPIVGYADVEASGTPDEFGNGKLYLTVSKQPFLNIKPDTLMAPKDLILAKDEKSTICLADSAGSVRFLKVKDEFDFSSDITTAFRFINLSNNLPNATLASSDGVLNVQNIPFWSESSFSTHDHGQFTMELRDASGNVLSSVSLWLGGRSAYTFYAVGNSLNYFVH